MSPTNDSPGGLSVTRIRIGLAIISVVVVIAVAMVFVVRSTPGKAVMFAIAFTAFVRAFLLVRSLRQERAAGSAEGDA